MVRCGMSVSANYRAARRARSSKEFAARVGVVLEEADETAHWLELLMDSGLVARNHLEALHTEAEELVRIFAATRRTARRKHRGVSERASASRNVRAKAERARAGGRSPDHQSPDHQMNERE